EQRQLSLGSTVEVGGVGGEVASGFYYTPVDRFMLTRQAMRKWVSVRVLRTGFAAASLFGADRWRETEHSLIERVLSQLEEVSGGLRRASDVFYLRQRI